MKTNVRILTLFFVIALLISSVGVCAFAGEQYIYGSLSLLNDDEQSQIISAMEEAKAECGADFRLVIHSGELLSSNTYLGMTSRSFSSDTVILVVRKNGTLYNYDLFTYGNADSAISDGEVDKMLDNAKVYDNIKSGKVSDGIIAFLHLCAKAIGGTLRAPFYTYLLPCAVIALVAVLITVFVIIRKYKTKLKSPSYPLDKFANLRLITSNDILVDTVVTRVKINTNSGGSRSGGGGGGGGHRGGR